MKKLGKQVKWLIGGIVLMAVLLFINQEIYEHRMYMAKAKEAIKEYKYDHATAYLEKADRFPFHRKVQTYIINVEEKKRESVLAFMSSTAKKEEAFAAYHNWIEQEILTPVSIAFEQYQQDETKTAKEMRDLFYQLNFKVEGKRVELSEEFLGIHQPLSNYIQKNQIAYSYWEKKNSVEAEKVRQEAIRAHTDFMLAFNAYAKEEKFQKRVVTDHYY